VTHPLDRPVWNALATTHADLAEGSALARRYRPSVIPFAAMADNGPESLAALTALPGADEMMVLVEAGPITVPTTLETVIQARWCR
jgi:hypothetical protein